MSTSVALPTKGRAFPRSWAATFSRKLPAQGSSPAAPAPSGPAFAALLPLHPPPAAGEGATAHADDAPPAAVLAGIPEAVLEQARAMGPLLPASARRRHTFSLVCACNMNR
jgi:hypothetical protein